VHSNRHLAEELKRLTSLDFSVSKLSARVERGGDTGPEDRLAANLEQLRREVVRLGRAQQALFAYLDTLGKTILTCMPEPPTDARPQAVARAKERYDRMLKSVAKAMAGDAQAAIQDLAAHVEYLLLILQLCCN
jgi:hypothetical protein